MLRSKFAQYLGALLLIASCAVLAEDSADVYRIEIIVFEHTDPQRFSAEKWPPDVGTLDRKNAIDLNNIEFNKQAQNVPASPNAPGASDTPSDTTVTLVDSQHRLLNSQALAIKTSKTQKLMLHLAWSQPLAWNVNSTPVFFSGRSDDQGQVQGILSVKPIKGMLQAHIDLIYSPATYDRANKTGVHEFRISQDFKLKKKELYYIDNPLIGVLIIAEPAVDEY